MSSKLIMADRTLFGSISRINIDNSTSFSYSFIFNKVLQLPESPLMHPSVISCGSSDVAQIFHHNSASIRNTINDSLAYIMVSPCHKPSPFARDFSQMSLSRFGAFGLKFTNQFIMLNSECFNLFPEEHLGGCNSEIIYSDIDAKNSVLETRAFDINIFRESEKKETSSFGIYPKQTFSNIPSKIFFVTIRNDKWNFNSSFDCGYTQDIVLERSTTREVVSHTNSVDYWLGFSLLDNSTGLFNTGDSQLALQSTIPEMLVNEWMELDVIPDMLIPSSIDTELQPFTINFESFGYLGSCGNLDFSCYSCLHNRYKEPLVFKSFGGGIPLHPNCFAVEDVVSCQR